MDRDILDFTCFETQHYSGRFYEYRALVYNESRMKLVPACGHYRINPVVSYAELCKKVMEKYNGNYIVFFDKNFSSAIDIHYHTHRSEYEAMWAGAGGVQIEYAIKCGLLKVYRYEKINKNKKECFVQSPKRFIEWNGKNYQRGYVIYCNDEVCGVVQQKDIAHHFVITKMRGQYIDKNNVPDISERILI